MSYLHFVQYVVPATRRHESQFFPGGHTAGVYLLTLLDRRADTLSAGLVVVVVAVVVADTSFAVDDEEEVTFLLFIAMADINTRLFMAAP